MDLSSVVLPIFTSVLDKFGLKGVAACLGAYIIYFLIVRLSAVQDKRFDEAKATLVALTDSTRATDALTAATRTQAETLRGLEMASGQNKETLGRIETELRSNPRRRST